MHTDLYLNGCGAEPENNSRRFRVGTIYPEEDAHAANAWESGWHRVQYVPERERFFVPLTGGNEYV